MIQFNQKKTSPKAKESISKSKYERKSVFISKKWKYEVKMRVFIIFYKLTWISLSMLQYFEIYCYTDCLPIRTWWQGLGVLPSAHYLRLEMPSLAFLYRHNPFSSRNSRHHRISFRIRWFVFFGWCIGNKNYWIDKEKNADFLTKSRCLIIYLVVKFAKDIVVNR